jgi:hypothetical protein
VAYLLNNKSSFPNKAAFESEILYIKSRMNKGRVLDS